MIIHYSDQDSDSCSDANVMQWYDSVKDQPSVKVATICQLNSLRVGHKFKQITIEYIKYGDTYLYIDDTGRLDEWPKGFLSIWDDLTDNILWADSP